jgi:hypothetical protein
MHPMSEAPKEFQKNTIALPAAHGWKCKEGNSLFVADRGAAAFEIPSGWVVRHDGKQTVTIHDRPPPGDSCRVSLTVFHLPPVQGGWGALPLSDLIVQLGELEQVDEAGQSGGRADSARRPLPWR